jgi:hypothetical protein
MSSNPYQTPSFSADKASVADSDLKLDRKAEMLRQTKPWVRFMSVMMLIGSVFMVLGGIVLMVSSAAGAFPGRIGALVGGMYIGMALLYIVPAIFLWMYASRIAVFLGDRSTSALASALESQKSFWKFVGIVMLIIICLYGAVIVFSIIMGVFVTV